MKYLIVFAHPENKNSFQKSLLDYSKTRLIDAGYECEVSDLYAMNFNPIASNSDFKTRRDSTRLQYDREQKQAVRNSSFTDDIQDEINKLLWCDVLILQFPLYWFSMPAIMKGWIDRVFVNSLFYGAGKRFETGGSKGKRAMVSTSTGGFDTMFDSEGLLGDINVALWHIHHGMLHYTGFHVMAPFVSWAPVRVGDEQCKKYHDDYVKRLLAIGQDTPMTFHNTSDFTDDFRLKEGIVPRTPGHWKK